MLYTFCRKKPVSHIQLKSLAPFGSQQRVVSREKTEDLEVRDEEEEFPFSDVPRPGKRWERKPYPTPMKVLIQRAKEEKRKRQENPCGVLEHPPENGLLVPELVEVARQVYNAREMLLHGLSKLVNGDFAIPVKRCL